MGEVYVRISLSFKGLHNLVGDVLKKGVILVSGGLDSATLLYYLKNKGVELHGLVFDYAQRHKRELKSAEALLKGAKVSFKKIKLEFPWKGSALTDSKLSVPKKRSMSRMNKGIPITYVPARNLIFLSLATGYAEAIGAEKIYYGANALDYSGYPDCRPDFVASLNQTIKKGTKRGAENKAIKIEAPLVKKSKKEIILIGKKYGVPFEKTWSCYSGGKKPCGQCDSCLLRAKGFAEAKLIDPCCG